MKRAIYMITTLFYPSIGGVENHVYNLSKEFVKKGYNVKIINPVINHGKNEINDLDGIEVHKISVGDKSDELKYKKYKSNSGENVIGFFNGYKRKYYYNKFKSLIYNYIENDISVNNYDDLIIHQHDFISSIKLSKMLAKKYSVKFTNHTGEFLFLKKIPLNAPLIKYLTNHFDYIIAPSEELSDFKGIRHDSKYRFLSNGVDTERFCIISENMKKELRSKYNIPKDKIIVFSPRRWAPTKGIIYLVKSIKILNRDDVVFIFAGSDYSDYPEYRKEILRYIDENKLQNKIMLLGDINYQSIDEYVKLSDIVVIPSLMEAISLSALEAMACGIPVVSTNVGGMPQIVLNEKTGLLVKSKNENELAKAIEKLVLNNQLRRQIGKNCREFVEMEYSWKHIADTTETIYFDNSKNKQSARG